VTAITPNNFKYIKMKNTNSVQEETAKITAELLEQTNLSAEYLEGKSLQQLVTLKEKMSLISKKDGKNVRSNISTEVLKHFIDAGNFEPTISEVKNAVKRFNLKGYFTLPENYDIWQQFEHINSDIILGYLVSNSQKMSDSSKRLTAWLSRKDAYYASHVIGQTDEGSLFNNKDAKHYFVATGNKCIITEKK